MKRVSFTGTISDINDLPPARGGKPHRYEVTLEDGGKAYVLPGQIYLEMDPSRELRSPLTRQFDENVSVGDGVVGEYVVWKKMKVIVAIRFRVEAMNRL